MELKEFVKSAILDIIEGVKDAQEANMTDAIINAVNNQYDSGDRIVQDVDFDLALTVSKSVSGNGRLEVSAASLLGGQVDGGIEQDSSSFSRVRFTIPIRFPSTSSKARR